MTELGSWYLLPAWSIYRNVTLNHKCFLIRGGFFIKTDLFRDCVGGGDGEGVGCSMLCSLTYSHTLFGSHGLHTNIVCHVCLLFFTVL